MIKLATKKLSKPAIIVALLLLLAFTLRFYNINKYDLWFDEVGTDAFSSQNLSLDSMSSGIPVTSLMIEKMRNDPHSPLYYFIVYIYSSIFGDGKSLRILSLFFSLLSLLFIYKLSRLFFNKEISIYALFIMAINPLHIYYAQEARMYAAACFFSLLLIFLYIKALKTNELSYWIYFTITAIFTIHLSYFSCPLLLACGATLFLKEYANRYYSKRYLISLLIITLFLLLTKPILSGQLNFVKNYFWIQRPSLNTLLFVFKVFNLGYSASSVQFWISIVLFTALFGYGIYSSSKSTKTGTIVFLIFLLFSITTIYIFSIILLPVFVTRQLIIFSPFYYILIANGIGNIRIKPLKIIVIICMTSLLMISIINYYKGYLYPPITHRNSTNTIVFSKKNYKELFLFLDREFKKEDIILAGDIQAYVLTLSHIKKNHLKYSNIPTNRLLRLLFYPYRMSEFNKKFLKINQSINEIPYYELSKLHSYAILSSGKTELKKMHLDEIDSERIWLVSSGWGKSTDNSPSTRKVKDELRQHFNEIYTKEKDTVYLQFYSKHYLEGLK